MGEMAQSTRTTLEMIWILDGDMDGFPGDAVGDLDYAAKNLKTILETFNVTGLKISRVIQRDGNWRIDQEIVNGWKRYGIIAKYDEATGYVIPIEKETDDTG